MMSIWLSLDICMQNVFIGILFTLTASLRVWCKYSLFIKVRKNFAKSSQQVLFYKDNFFLKKKKAQKNNLQINNKNFDFSV